PELEEELEELEPELEEELEELEPELEEELEELEPELEEELEELEPELEEEELEEILIGTQESIDSDSLQHIIPLEETEIVDDVYIPHYNLGYFKNLAVQKYTDKLAPFLEEYNISHYTIAEEETGLYIFNNEAFGAQFIIDQGDSLFQEVLSKGHALSLSGDLTESEYLENLFSYELVAESNELYIRPIMDQGKVAGIIVLIRDKDFDELSHEEKKDLLMNHEL
ncbi:MAG: hypothetical protein ACRCWI_06515, partial [Brevinema sp.]